MQISIAGYSFHGAIAAGTMDVFGYLESCRYRYHLDTADLWCGLLGKDPEAYLDPAFLRKVRDGLRERGLTVVNYHADGCHIWEDDPDVRRQMRAMAERQIAAAEYLGARTVRIDAGGRERQWTNEQFDAIVATYREWARRAHDRGYAIGPETHWGAENFPDNMAKLSQAVGPRGYGILLHMGKDVTGDPDAYDRELAPFAIHTHFDAKTTYGRAEAALRILLASGYRGCLGVEHHSARNELAEVAVQLETARRALSVVEGEQLAAAASANPLLDPRDERAHQTRALG